MVKKLKNIITQQSKSDFKPSKKQIKKSHSTPSLFQVISQKNGDSTNEEDHHSQQISDSSQVCYQQTHLEDQIFHKAKQVIQSGVNDSFYIINLQSIKERYNLWHQHLPFVKMYYAVKSNSNEQIVRELVRLGSSFDCASLEEIKLALEMGAKPDSIIFANPCKNEQHILYAKQKQVKLMTFDSSEEVIRIRNIFPEAELILRIAVVETDAPNPMGKKFGAPQSLWEQILDTCIEQNMKLRGVSFHVGSGGCSFQAYKDSIENTKSIFETAEQKGINTLDIVDIGGGYSMNSRTDSNNFNFIAPQIESLLKNYFPGNNKKIQIIGEPGRLICQEAQTIAVRIFLARQQQDCRHYFVNNGVYQAFGCQVFDLEYFKGQPLLEKDIHTERASQQLISFIWGQTCDGVDWLSKNKMFPMMYEGEWILYRNFGAYGQALACQFNGFPLPNTYYV